jgi:hypothetical protein
MSACGHGVEQKSAGHAGSWGKQALKILQFKIFFISSIPPKASCHTKNYSKKACIILLLLL